MKTVIQFLGHSCFLITTSNNIKILIDPFLRDNPTCPDNLKDPGIIDFIGLTHGHSDHTSDAVFLAKKYNAKVFATYELASLISADGVSQEQIEFMNKGGRIPLGEDSLIFASLTSAQHSSSYQNKNGETKYAGEACGIILELPENKVIYHLGDTCLFSDLKLIGETFKPTVALVPIGDRFTMGPKDAAIATSLINPEYVIPIHWGTFDLLSGTPEDFSAQLGHNRSKLVTLNPGESFKA